MATDRDYRTPDFDEPLDSDAHVAAVPADGTVRGMFLTWLDDELRRAGQEPATQESWLAFRTYPTRDYCRELVRTAERVHPGIPLREAMRRIGFRVFPSFADTMIGSAIFSVAGRSFLRIAQLSPRAYAVSIEPGEVRVPLAEPGRVVVEFRRIWTFPDSFQVGIWEGAMATLGIHGDVRTRVHGPADVDFLVTW